MFGDLADIQTSQGGTMTDGLKTEEGLAHKAAGGMLGFFLMAIFILPMVISLVVFAALVGGSAVLCAWVIYAVYQRVRHGRSLRAVATNSALSEADQANNPFAGLQR